MLVVGVIEVVAGIGVALRPRIFSYVVAAWLLGIIGNLLLFPPTHPWPHYDVALRDLGLCLGAWRWAACRSVLERDLARLSVGSPVPEHRIAGSF